MSSQQFCTCPPPASTPCPAVCLHLLRRATFQSRTTVWATRDVQQIKHGGDASLLPLGTPAARAPWVVQHPAFKGRGIGGYVCKDLPLTTQASGVAGWGPGCVVRVCVALASVLWHVAPEAPPWKSLQDLVIGLSPACSVR